MRPLISYTLTIIVLMSNIILAPQALAAEESYEAQLREKLEASATAEKPKPLPANPSDKSDSGDWVIVTGKWEVQGEMVKYLGPDDEKCSTPHGIILHKTLRMWSGAIETTINFPKELGSAHILFSYNPMTKNFYTAGLGGKLDAAYTLTQFSTLVPVVEGCHSGISDNDPVSVFGNKNDLLPNSDDKVKLSVQPDGNISLRVNNVKVINNSPQSVCSDHVGLFAWGTNPVEFKNFKVNAEDLLK